jgi:hypothetical protein
LISHLSDPDPYARLMAAAALGKLGAAEAVGPLTQALRDPDEGVRYMAGVALRELAAPRPSAAGEAYPPESAGESGRPAVGSPAPLSARRRRRPVVGVLAALAAIGCIGGTVGILMVGASIPRIVGLIQVPSSTPTQVPAPSLTPTSTPRPTPTPDAATPLAASACNGELSFVQGRQPDFEETFWDSEYFQQRWGDLCPGCTVTGGVLSMDISVDQGMTGIVVPVRATDFALQIETTPRVVSDSLAVVVDFRVHEATGYYSLALFPDFDAFVLDVNRPGAEGIITTPLWQSTMADLGEGVQTTVLIIARDDRFSVYLDDALVACLQDPGPLTGATHDIRIITQSGPVHVDVDNLRLWDLAGLGGE